METKDLLNGAFGILLYISTYPLIYIILTAVFGGEYQNNIECLTLILGTIFGTILCCLSWTNSIFK